MSPAGMKATSPLFVTVYRQLFEVRKFKELRRAACFILALNALECLAVTVSFPAIVLRLPFIVVAIIIGGCLIVLLRGIMPAVIFAPVIPIPMFRLCDGLVSDWGLFDCAWVIPIRMLPDCCIVYKVDKSNPDDYPSQFLSLCRLY
jgi:hypothetical protein